MSREEKLFLLKLVDGNMSIFDENFSDADIEEAEEERMAVMEQISSLLPEKGRWKIMDQLEGAILNERGEACRLAYVLGMQMGARLVRALNADSLLTLFFVKYFSLKKASKFPFFSKGFSLPSAGIMHPCA